jgi:hypothetical protein
LRDRHVDLVPALDPQETPAIVISPQTESLSLSSAYRGQDFIWRREPSWEVMSIYEWIKWSVFREVPYDSETVILWVRNDLFPEASGSLP